MASVNADRITRIYSIFLFGSPGVECRHGKGRHPFGRDEFFRPVDLPDALTPAIADRCRPRPRGDSKAAIFHPVQNGLRPPTRSPDAPGTDRRFGDGGRPSIARRPMASLSRDGGGDPLSACAVRRLQHPTFVAAHCPEFRSRSRNPRDGGVGRRELATNHLARQLAVVKNSFGPLWRNR